ncbi:SDR family NAD(P)-dependent oxidoreductase [Polyangium aurulentum]|uniref:SDR family NAD(P)-dependent oxidoreductase n=1 Tax=Polyangium aurulentum TaxID=2567896 RepID=UPI0010AEC9C3|nr:SDR family NAD(P)-dependent oxidoreductase [Polyangium aurulentum]UQA60837.1 SDR family oxidoreductase [Polyangium aurulentum]
MSAEQRVVFVTGGRRGIGAAVAERFKESGFLVAVCARSASEPPPYADEFIACDVSDAASVRDCVARVIARFGRLDVLVNNAGIAGENPMDPAKDDAIWHRMIAVNLDGTYFMCKHALPHLPDGSGRIINVASTLALKGAPDQIGYTAAKHGVLGLTRALARYAAPRRITVNAICPGWTRTDLADERMRDLGLTLEQAEQGVPIGRILEPREVADLALYLAGPSAGGITGQALVIDGGYLA